MPSDRPDPGDFIAQAQRMLRQLLGDARPDDGDPWGAATRSARVHREPSPDEQRENLTFALATRAVEALEDLALNVAAIRQRLERTGPATPDTSPETGAEPAPEPASGPAARGDDPPAA